MFTAFHFVVFYIYFTNSLHHLWLAAGYSATNGRAIFAEISLVLILEISLVLVKHVELIDSQLLQLQTCGVDAEQGNMSFSFDPTLTHTNRRTYVHAHVHTQTHAYRKTHFRQLTIWSDVSWAGRLTSVGQDV